MSKKIPEGKFNPPFRIFGRSETFDYSIHLIKRAWNTERIHALGIVGAPFVGKRTLAGALKCWFEESTEIKCYAIEPGDSVVQEFDGVVFIYDIDRRDDADRIFELARKAETFVVYTTCTDETVPGSQGLRVHLNEMDRESSMRMISVETGIDMGIIRRCADQALIDVPSSPLVLRSICDRVRKDIRPGMTEKDLASTMRKHFDPISRCSEASKTIPKDEFEWWDEILGDSNENRLALTAYAMSRSLEPVLDDHLTDLNLTECAPDDPSRKVLSEGARCLILRKWPINAKALDYLFDRLRGDGGSCTRDHARDLVELCHLRLEHVPDDDSILVKAMDMGVFEMEPLLSPYVLQEALDKLSAPSQESVEKIRCHEFLSICQLSYGELDRLNMALSSVDCDKGFACRFFRDTLDTRLFSERSNSDQMRYYSIMEGTSEQGTSNTSDSSEYNTTNVGTTSPAKASDKIHYMLMRHLGCKKPPRLVEELAQAETEFSSMRHDLPTAVRVELDLCRIHSELRDRITAERHYRKAIGLIERLDPVPYDIRAGKLECESGFRKLDKDYRWARDLLQEAMDVCKEGNLVYQSILLRTELLALYNDMGRTSERETLKKELESVKDANPQFRLLCSIIDCAIANVEEEKPKGGQPVKHSG